MKKKISLVIPVLNESKNIQELYEHISKSMLEFEYEIIFVDDGSTDETAETLKVIVEEDYNVKVVRLRRNFGKAIAYSAGFQNAQGDIVITMDGDLQDDPGEIHKFISKIEEGYDVVNGWKYRGKGRWDKTLASMTFNKITSLLSGVKLHDFNCPFKAYRKEVLEELDLYGDLFRFIPVLVREKGYSIGEVKIENRLRRFGKSKYSFSRYPRTMLDLMTVLFLTKFKKSPLYLFGSLGLLMFGSGFFIDLYLVFQKIFNGLKLSEQPLLLLGILLMVVGAQFISIGLITEMMVSLFHKKDKINLAVREILSKKQ